MSTFSINEGLYINVTPRGAYSAVHSSNNDITQDLLITLLQQSETPELSNESLESLLPGEASEQLSFVNRMQKLGLVAGQEQSESVPKNSLEDLLPELLGSLSDSGKALLADQHGLYLGSAGFTHEAAEELAAISANLSEVYQRHRGLLQGNLGFSQNAWGLIDAAGNAEVGFWPLYIGNNIFTLILQGLPQLNQPSFKQLVWLLVKRYGSNTE